MLKVILPDRVLGVSFRYGPKPKDEDLKLGIRKERLTKCEVVEILDNNVLVVLAVGIAKCDKRDNFSKKAGRKISLAHALIKKDIHGKTITKFTKFERAAIWKAYHDWNVDPQVIQVEKAMRAQLDADIALTVENDSLGG